MEKERFEYLKVDKSQGKVEYVIIKALYDLYVSPKIIKSPEVNSLINIIKNLIKSRDYEDIKRTISQCFRIEKKSISYSDEEFLHEWRIVDDPPDGVIYKIIRFKKSNNITSQEMEETIVKKEGKYFKRRYNKEELVDEEIVANVKIDIDRNKDFKDLVDIKIYSDLSTEKLEFSMKKDEKNLVTEKEIDKVLLENHITFKERLYRNPKEKIGKEEKEAIERFTEREKERAERGRRIRKNKDKVRSKILIKIGGTNYGKKYFKKNYY